MPVTICEQQLVRPDGTVIIRQQFVDGLVTEWGLEYKIEGEVLWQSRILPENVWVTHARFPRGYPGWAELP